MKKKIKILVLLLTIGLQSYGQSQKVSGTVTDDAGLTLPGATVIVVGTKTSSITDMEGKYVINAKAGDKLNFSYVGFKDQILTVGKGLVVNAKMENDSKTLDEVIVVGYSTQKKTTVTGAVAQTTGETLKRQGSVVSIKDALQGALAGVTVLPSNGLPGGGNGQDGAFSKATDILIRGKNTWNNSSPLILVDGVERNIDDIDINEVETISVLKDASATAVYGMKGGNGVILITSRRGNVGKAKLSFEFNQTFEGLSKYSENVGTLAGFEARNYAILNEVDVLPNNWNSYLSGSELQHYRDQDLPYAFADINWRDQMVKDFASSQRFNVNVSGGNNFVKYFNSISYNHQGDIFKITDVGQGYNPQFSYDRFNFRTNLDFNITKTTQFIVGMSGVYGKQQRSGAGTTSAFTAISGHTPNTPILQYEDGVYGYDNTGITIVATNLFADLNLSGTEVDNRTEINTDYTFIQKLDIITKGLNVKGKLAWDNYFSTRGRAVNGTGYTSKFIDPKFYLAGGSYNYQTKTYELNGVPLSTVDMINAGFATYRYPATTTNGFTSVEQPVSFDNEVVDARNNATRTNLYYEASLNYNRKFGNHTVTGLALFSRQIVNSGSDWPQKREDWVGRVTYDYNSKYLLEVNGAYNGSEKFGPGYKFDFFPSISPGWVISKESFIKNHAKFIDFLKLRYSFGVVGNDRIDGQQWGYITTWQQGGIFTDDADKANFGINNVPSYLKYYEGIPGNPELRWEKAEKQNIGLDFEFLKRSITGTIDVFKEHRYDMLIAGSDRTIPVIYGQTPPAANLGIVDSHGLEIEAFYQKSYENGFNFKIGGNYTRAENKIIQKEDAELKPTYQQQAGFPIGQIRLTQQTGFINSYDDLYNGVNGNGSNVQVLPGDFRMMDYNANGVIDPDDAAPYGYPQYPLNTYTAQLNLGYKGWSFNVMFYGTQNVTREVTYSSFFSQSSLIQPHYINDTWTPQYNNANPSYPALSFTKNSSSGTYNFYDGSLLRLKSAEIAYTLPKNWSKSFAASKTRLYINGNNLFLWTDMPADGEGGKLESRQYPLKRTVTIGANIQF
jgi:TonB-linked SusC/RagA family outer membrane protein